MSEYLIIFDLDGTLVQSKIEYAEMKDALKLLLKDLIGNREYKQFTSIPRSILEIVSFIAKKDDSGEVNRKAWEIVEEYELAGYEKAEMYEDVLPTLLSLKKEGHKIAILTNNSRKLTNLALEKFNLKPLVEYVVTRDEVEKTKPDPEGIEKILDHFNKQKSETLFIGDSWLDAEAAVRANIKFAYFGKAKALETREKEVKIDTSIENIEDVNQLIRFEK